MTSRNALYGLVMFLGFLTYFFIMKALGLYTEVYYRIFNIFIHGGIVYLAMKHYREQTDENFKYLDTFWVGFKTAVLPVIAFALFQFGYLEFMNPEFMAMIKQKAIMGKFLTPLLASMFLIIEGIAVSVFTAYVGMRILTAEENVPKVS